MIYIIPFSLLYLMSQKTSFYEKIIENDRLSVQYSEANVSENALNVKLSLQQYVYIYMHTYIEG